MPKSQIRGKKRAGGHNSLTRTRIKPLLLAGGYAQFTYGFNYWGPTGAWRSWSGEMKRTATRRCVTCWCASWTCPSTPRPAARVPSCA
jgi:nitrate reductase alpha subunit